MIHVIFSDELSYVKERRATYLNEAGEVVEQTTDNKGVSEMIYAFKTNSGVINIYKDEDQRKFDQSIYNGFKYSEAMLQNYCDAQLKHHGIPMSPWGNLLGMIRLAMQSDNNVARIWNIRCYIKANPEILDTPTPTFLPKSRDEEWNQLLWRNWRGENAYLEKDGCVYFLTVTAPGRRLSMEEINSLHEYGKSNMDLGIEFLGHNDYLKVIK